LRANTYLFSQSSLGAGGEIWNAGVDNTDGFTVDESEMYNILGDDFDTGEDPSAWGGLGGEVGEDGTEKSENGGKFAEKGGTAPSGKEALMASMQQHQAESTSAAKASALADGEQKSKARAEDEELEEKEKKRRIQERERTAMEAKARDEAESRFISNNASVDMDEQRLMMANYDDDAASGGSSPSSDYGF